MNHERDSFADCDTTSEQLLMDWQSLGIGRRREVRSHRAPRKHISPRYILLGATAVAALGTLSSATINHLGAETSHVSLAATNPQTYTDKLTVSTNTNVLSDETRRERSADVATRSKRTVPSVTARWVEPVAKIRITSCYGSRSTGQHMGIDFAAPTGTPIVAVGSGKIVQAGWRYQGLGYSVVIDHGGGQMTLYGHASKILVRTGQKVSAGSKIALVGSTGHSTGPHVHLGVAKTKNVGSLFDTLTNPAPWLKSHGLSSGRC
jgi:murein DD-endopeptidase MepM/ murein hydrolase activator NlpD